MFGAWSVCTHVHISSLYHHFLYLSFLVFLFFFSLSSRPKINKYLISKLAQRSIAFCRSSLYFFLFFLFLFTSSSPHFSLFSPLIPPSSPPPLHYNEAGTTYLSTLLRLSLPLISFFSRFIHTSKTSRYWQSVNRTGHMKFCAIVFHPVIEYFLYKAGNLIQRSFECRALFPFVHSLLSLSLFLPFLESMKSWRAS